MTKEDNSPNTGKKNPTPEGKEKNGSVIKSVPITELIGKDRPNSTFKFKGTKEEAKKLFPNVCIVKGCHNKMSEDCPECYCFKHCNERCMNGT